MKRFLLFLTLALALLSHAFAQGSSDDDANGVLDEGVFTNQRYGITFTLPAGWQSVTEEQRQTIEQRMNTTTSDVRPFVVLLHPSPNGEPPDVIFVSGARINPFAGISRNSAIAYFKALPKSKTSQVIRPADSFLLGGLLVARQDFQMTFGGRQEYMAHMAIVIRDRLISLQVNSVSRDRLEQGVQAVVDNTEFEPDWISRARKPAAAGEPQKPLRVSESVLMGLVQTKVAARLPDGLDGKSIKVPVNMHVLVSAGGDVEKVWVFEGLATLAWPAVEAVRQWHFRPYVVDQKALPVESTISFDFR